MIQPFEIIEGMDSMKYAAVFASDSVKKLLVDRERYKVFVEVDPWDKVCDVSCECKGFTFGKGKRWCKHISSKDNDNPGLFQLLKIWGEIEEIPTLEDKDDKV